MAVAKPTYHAASTRVAAPLVLLDAGAVLDARVVIASVVKVDWPLVEVTSPVLV